MASSFTTALCLILLSRFCDGLDGTIARQLGVTDRGAFLDISLDFLFYSWIPLSFALHDAQNALAPTFLIFSFVEQELVFYLMRPLQKEVLTPL